MAQITFDFRMPEKPKYTRNPEDTCDESCSICLRHFTSRKQLGKHLAFHESRHDVKAPMNCPACGIECTKATLNTHYREHHHPGKQHDRNHSLISLIAADTYIHLYSIIYNIANLSTFFNRFSIIASRVKRAFPSIFSHAVHRD